MVIQAVQARLIVVGLTLLLFCALVQNACSSSEEPRATGASAAGSPGTGGSAAGSGATGGTSDASTGGTSGVAGTFGASGALGDGGTLGTGGAAAGGRAGSGGTIGSGGASGNDGGLGTGGATGGSSGNAGSAGSVGCPAGLRGPTLVEVPAPGGGRYCVDATEVTNAHYAAFLAAGYPTSGQIAPCAWNTSYVPIAGWPATGKHDYPVLNVDWCDAYAFCQWADKRLCGKIGGGANAYSDYAQASRSQWYNACSAGGTRTYPYGSTFSATACNGDGNGVGATVPVGSKPGCQGGYPGLFDLSGNASEWEDSCDASTGRTDRCMQRGSSFLGNAGSLACGVVVNSARDFGYGIGIRCCGA